MIDDEKGGSGPNCDFVQDLWTPDGHSVPLTFKIDVYGISCVQLGLISIHGVFLLPHTELIDN